MLPISKFGCCYYYLFFFMDGLSMRFDAKKLKQEKELAQGKGEEGKNSGNSVLELIVHAFMGVYTLFQ